jgi:beta-glucanase (GH16 family)
MVGKSMVPHIEIMKAGKKLYYGNSWGDARNLKSVKRYIASRGRNRFSKDFYIYTLEWKPNVLSWKINGIEVARSTNGVPDQPMYIVLSAGLQNEVNGVLPTHMEVDWVRCYQKNDLSNAKK